MAETVGMLTLAPYWNGGASVGEFHALALFIAAAGVMFLLLASTEPGTALSTRVNRYMFALMGGVAFNVVATWGLWAIGYPMVNGTIQRGLMAENYWLGPVILAYAVVVWMVYRHALAKETKPV
ncbi:hypothetical protein [Paraburkholderia humisilvae]|nr:hypothetical protein [Paraburkholderia humisilvae]